MCMVSWRCCHNNRSVKLVEFSDDAYYFLSNMHSLQFLKGSLPCACEGVTAECVLVRA